MAVISSTLEVGEDQVEARPVRVESWFNEYGAARKRRRLERKGIPCMRDWRFTTLTIADRSLSPHDAYLKGKDRLRRFLAQVRELVGHQFRWFWKLEFHHDGYPHWHLAWEHTAKLTEGELTALGDCWGLGRVNTKRIRGDEMQYLFKYAAKSATSASGDLCLGVPEWVLHAKKLIRVVQASRGFYLTPPPPRQSKAPTGAVRKVRSLAEREERAKSMALIVRYNRETGLPEKIRQVVLPVTYDELYRQRLARTHAECKPWVTTRGFVFEKWEAVFIGAGASLEDIASASVAVERGRQHWESWEWFRQAAARLSA